MVLAEGAARDARGKRRAPRVFVAGQHARAN
jgi:hypothetical protein